jgi:hypothetical protein
MGPEDLQVWLNHFEYHADGGRRAPLPADDILSSNERRLIARSIASFQLGAEAQGGGLMRAAERFAEANRMTLLTRIIHLMHLEERRHAAMLKTFMQDHRIALEERDYTDRLLRCVSLAGFELYLHVLICRELIGIVYYRALVSVTRCLRLRNLCRVLVADELAHIGFESHLLLWLRARRAPAVQWILRRVHRAFFLGAAAFVWSRHRAVLRRAGYNLASFLSTCLAQYDFYLEPPLTRSSRRESSRSCNLS